MKIEYTMPANEYHATRALSSSALPALAKSPAHLLEYWQNPPEQTAEMRTGRAIHALKHEDEKVLVCDASTRTTKIYKEMAEANPGVLIMLASEMEDVKRAVDALDKHPRVRELYSNGKAEVSGFWECPETKVKCKGRADFIRDDGMIIDLKSSLDASEGFFQTTLMKRKYHWQSAWYLDGFAQLLNKSMSHFVHVVVERVAPYGISIFVLDDASLQKARENILELKRRYAECLHTGEYPGYTTQIMNITIPTWGFGLEVSNE